MGSFNSFVSRRKSYFFFESSGIFIFSDFIFSKESVEGEARKIGYFESYFDDFNAQKQYVKGIKEVTNQDVIRVAKKYLPVDNLTTAILLSKDNSSISEKNLEEIVYKENEKEKAKKKETKNLYSGKLSNGMKVVIKTIKNVPTVAINISFNGGTRAENRENNGIFNLISNMLTKGTGGKSSYQLAV